MLSQHELGMLTLENARKQQEQADNARLKMILAITNLGQSLNLGQGKAPVEEPAPDFERVGSITSDNVTTAPIPSGNLDINKIMQAIGKFESGGRYGEIGKATHSGDRAYGKYQIMGSNIPAWSKEALGYSVNKDTFLKDPKIQDLIAQHKMQQYYDKYGNIADVSSMWFSGRPYRGNARRDVLGTSVPQYVQGVNRYLKF